MYLSYITPCTFPGVDPGFLISGGADLDLFLGGRNNKKSKKVKTI